MWFKVDDKAHSNSKIRKVLAEEPAALALWTVAGSWSADNTTDGFIPDHQLPWLIPARAEELARTLVAARLWRRVKGGYQFHQWEADGDGTPRNPLKKSLDAMRLAKAEAGRKGGVASGKTRSRSQARASADASADALGLVEPPSHPIPSQKSSSNSSPPDGFDEFWKTYPPRRNSSRAEAAKAYTRAIKSGADPADILTGATLYAADRGGQDQQYTAHAATWLNQKRWEVLLEQGSRARIAAAKTRGWWEN